MIKPSELTRYCTVNEKKTLMKCDALSDLVPFVQFKKREKTPMEEC